MNFLFKVTVVTTVYVLSVPYIIYNGLKDLVINSIIDHCNTLIRVHRLTFINNRLLTFDDPVVTPYVRFISHWFLKLFLKIFIFFPIFSLLVISIYIINIPVIFILLSFLYLILLFMSLISLLYHIFTYF